MNRITVQLGQRSYPICVSLTGKELPRMVQSARLPSRACIITNKRVRNIAGAFIGRALRNARITPEWLGIPDSENAKTFPVYQRIVTALAKRYRSAPFFIAALGGGVIGDVAGFAAATFRRGVPYIQIPTTLLAQIDSAIGGKTAINLPTGKNLLGSFHQPRLVFSWIPLLTHLNPRQFRSGLAELIKYAVIADPQLFAYLESAAPDLIRLRPRALQTVVAAASAIKARIVALDERETTGLRTILNFGHTVGHALETAAGYRLLTHGEAVAIGMVAAGDIAAELGLCDDSFCRRLEALITRYGLPTCAPRLPRAKVMRALMQDKKFIHGTIRLVLPCKIGHVVVLEHNVRRTIAVSLQKRIGAK